MTFNSPFSCISTAVCPIKSREDSPTLLTSSPPCYTQSSPRHLAQAAGWVWGKQYQIHRAPVILADIKAHRQLLQVKARLASSNFLCICGDANCSTVNLEATNSHTLLSSSAHTHLHSQVLNTSLAFCILCDFFPPSSSNLLCPLWSCRLSKH